MTDTIKDVDEKEIGEVTEIPSHIFKRLSPMKQKVTTGFHIVGPLKLDELLNQVNGCVYKIYETDEKGSSIGEWRLETSRSGYIVSFDKVINIR